MDAEIQLPIKGDSKHCCCETHIHIDHIDIDQVNICSSLAGGIQAQPVQATSEPQIIQSDFCIPVTQGHKPKKNLATKLRPVLKIGIPSTLAAGMFQMAKRYLAGEKPAHNLEEEAFAVFSGLSPAIQDVLACAVRKTEKLPENVSKKLFDTKILTKSSDPFTIQELGKQFIEELRKRAAKTMNFIDENPACLDDEHPGLARRTETFDEVPFFTPKIYQVNDFRTDDYEPELSLGDYREDEFERVAVPEEHDGERRINYTVKTDDCPGNEKDGHCLRVAGVMPDDTVKLVGLNFYNIDGYVRITLRSNPNRHYDVEAYVCGDTETPLYEEVDGLQKIIRDSRVQDILTFRIPHNIGEGIYSIAVVMPNNTGFAPQVPSFESRPQYIRVLPAEDIVYQIATEELYVKEETGWDWSGEDTLGLNVVAIPILPDGAVGQPVRTEIRKNDCDTGEHKSMEKVLFQMGNIAGVALVILGYEIDDEDFYQEQIEGFWNALSRVVVSEFGAISDAVGIWAAAVIAVIFELGAGWAGIIAAAIAAALNICYASWAPADLIIEDEIGLGVLELSTRTNANYPPPPEEKYNTDNDIAVTVESESKGVEYREWRKYRGDGSEYHILFRYGRVP